MSVGRTSFAKAPGQSRGHAVRRTQTERVDARGVLDATYGSRAVRRPPLRPRSCRAYSGSPRNIRPYMRLAQGRFNASAENAAGIVVRLQSRPLQIKETTETRGFR